MTWARLDDRLHGNPKMLELWHTRRSAVALWLFGLTYSAQHETDGLVPEPFVKSLLPKRSEFTCDTNALMNAGLWEPVEGGWVIPDFLEFNPSKEQTAARRAADAERKARGRQRIRADRDAGVRPDSVRSPTVVSARPGPARPDPDVQGSESPVGLSLVGPGMSDVEVRRARPSTADLGGEVA